jgi:hypothetical protein
MVQEIRQLGGRLIFGFGEGWNFDHLSSASSG